MKTFQCTEFRGKFNLSRQVNLLKVYRALTKNEGPFVRIRVHTNGKCPEFVLCFCTNKTEAAFLIAELRNELYPTYKKQSANGPDMFSIRELFLAFGRRAEEIAEKKGYSITLGPNILRAFSERNQKELFETEEQVSVAQHSVNVSTTEPLKISNDKELKKLGVSEETIKLASNYRKAVADCKKLGEEVSSRIVKDLHNRVKLHLGVS